MTAERQERKQNAIGALSRAIVMAAVAACMQFSSAAANEAIVVDQRTGLAIAGYDPVAFYTNHKPMLGRGDFELGYGGAIWRFCNSGNREAFAARPDIYSPQFGGYDPLGVANGAPVAGNPNVWLITGERLLLFYSRERRDRFAQDAGRWFAAATDKWPMVSRTLSPDGLAQ
jgi:hypothetical protein